MNKTEVAEMAEIKVKVANIEKTNEVQNCMLKGIQTSVDKFSEWAKQKDKIDNRQDSDIKFLMKDKANKKDMTEIKALLYTIISSVVVAILTKMIGFW